MSDPAMKFPEVGIGIGEAQVFRPYQSVDPTAVLLEKSKQRDLAERQKALAKQKQIDKAKMPEIPSEGIPKAYSKDYIKRVEEFYNDYQKNIQGIIDDPVIANEYTIKGRELLDYGKDLRTYNSAYFKRLNESVEDAPGEWNGIDPMVESYNTEFSGGSLDDARERLFNDIDLVSSTSRKPEKIDFNKTMNPLKSDLIKSGGGYRINPETGAYETYQTEKFDLESAKGLVERSLMTNEKFKLSQGRALEEYIDRLPEGEENPYNSGNNYQDVVNFTHDNFTPSLVVDEYEERATRPPKPDTDQEFESSLDTIIRRIQNNDRSAMDLLVGSNYLGSTISEIAPSSKGLLLTLANGDQHDIDVSKGSGAYNEIRNALRGADSKRHGDIKEVAKQPYSGDTNWDMMNKDIDVISKVDSNEKTAFDKLESLGFTDVSYDDDVLSFTDPNGTPQTISMDDADIKKTFENPSEVTQDDIDNVRYEAIRKLLTEQVRDAYAVSGTGINVGAKHNTKTETQGVGSKYNTEK